MDVLIITTELHGAEGCLTPAGFSGNGETPQRSEEAHPRPAESKHPGAESNGLCSKDLYIYKFRRVVHPQNRQQLNAKK